MAPRSVNGATVGCHGRYRLLGETLSMVELPRQAPLARGESMEAGLAGVEPHRDDHAKEDPWRVAHSQ